MPLWRIYANSNTFTDEQKAGLSEAITELYTAGGAGLPAFYVVVAFVPVQDEAIFVGGKAKQNFVRITVEHIARTLPGPETEEGRQRRRGMMDRWHAGLKPWIGDREDIEWELHISETPRDLWSIQGIHPPPTGSEAEKQWVTENRPSPWE